MYRLFIVAFIFSGSIISAYAQSADEALRYSQLRFGGSARGMAVGGAFGAIGADFSGVISNPAGLGLVRKTELMFTLQLQHIKVDSDLDGNLSNDDKFNFNLANLGIMIPIAIKKSNSKWKFANLGIGYNRIANFHSSRYYRDPSSANSILQGLAAELNGIPENQIQNSKVSFEAVQAYNTYLLNPLPNDNTLYNSVTDNATVEQVISTRTRGGISELSFSAAGNYNDKVYIGGSLGIPFLVYREVTDHSETNNASAEQFNYFNIENRLNTTGAGVNFKMGIIYRPFDWLRFGGAFHTPSYFGMNDEFSTYTNSDFDTIAYESEQFIGEFDYNLSTPMRTVASVGFILRQYAFISFDYEWVDHARAKYRMASEYTGFEQDLNNAIQANYGSAHIFRTGLELSLDIFRLRGGFAHYGSPLENKAGVGGYDGAVNYYTFGAGLRFTKVYVDFAYVRGVSKTQFVTANVVSNDKYLDNNFVLTTGFRF